MEMRRQYVITDSDGLVIRSTDAYLISNRLIRNAAASTAIMASPFVGSYAVAVAYVGTSS